MVILGDSLLWKGKNQWGCEISGKGKLAENSKAAIISRVSAKKYPPQYSSIENSISGIKKFTVQNLDLSWIHRDKKMSNNSTQNTINPSPLSTEDPLDHNLFGICLYSLPVLCHTFGLYFIFKTRHVLHPIAQWVYILNMAVCELVYSIVLIVTYALSYRYPNISM